MPSHPMEALLPAATASHAMLAAAAMQGLLLMAGLILAIGAQNALVLRQGLARQHVVPVVALCIVSDWLLSAAGVFGFGAWIARQPTLMEAFRFGGALFLLWCALQAARRASQGEGALMATARPTATLGATLVATLAVTWLNPHVYLDTVVLLGGVGARHAGAARWAFLAGACAASALWFALLGAGAMAASRWLRHPATWRAIDAGIALVMLGVAAQLLWAPPA
ncbi:LysE/ArgO family amino acid transporter [Rivibacter subsaxonicus]|uniref:L-lysine exporter family protein LysE/ArgO n=1 Tax=Rivibacter subsaxonicus TaxID=457575 RepID=A0A4V6MEP3_9BURK|nr:LysE/ArgO family amino acid transporter [Rivibacter subsaxonicus]RZU00746.1 L-lysine exporter family protein LysE/ArgO [Rivibacter subsaxonicus]